MKTPEPVAHPIVAVRSRRIALMYVLGMVLAVTAMFVYEDQARQNDREVLQQQAERDRQFTEDVCASLQEYRAKSNARRAIIANFFDRQLTNGVDGTGEPLRPEEKAYLKSIKEGFSPVPELEACGTDGDTERERQRTSGEDSPG